MGAERGRSCGAVPFLVAENKNGKTWLGLGGNGTLGDLGDLERAVLDRVWPGYLFVWAWVARRKEAKRGERTPRQGC